MSKLIKFFDEISINDVEEVGGKNASLGEMYSKLQKKGVKIPNGFATTSNAYNQFLKENKIDDDIQEILKGLDTHDVTDLAKRGAAVRKTIMGATLGKQFEKEILEAYKKLNKGAVAAEVAVRSSATAEDLPDASFAGQQETFLNIKGEEKLLHAIKECIASLFTNRAISYRVDKGFSHFDVALSVGVQKMVRSDLGSSGVMFTIGTESGFQNAVLINSIYGLGENIVQGKVNPDEFYVFKPTEKIISKTIGGKKLRMIYNNDPNAKSPVKDVEVPQANRDKQSITDDQIIQLAKWGIIIEKHYKQAMDIEWGYDGKEKQLYILQARPETVHNIKNYNVLEDYIIEKQGKIIATGQSVGKKIGTGQVNKIMDTNEMKNFKKGQILVTDMTDPDWEPIMKIAAGIVTNDGGRTCHAAIISRELGIPCIVGTNDGSEKIPNNIDVTISCAEGEVGYIYEGKVPFTIKKTNIEGLKRPKTKIMMNIGSPDMAFDASFIPNDGVGLAREEFIITNHIKIHPLALINYDKIEDKKVKKQIDDLTNGYTDKKQFFIDKLAEGVGRISAAFYPNDVIVRMSDFKTNEYANLIGGREYEPVEANPMIGWRGTSRYYDENFEPAFALECAALKKVRDEMGLTNLKIMFPFVRTVTEAKKVVALMEKYGLKQGENGLEFYCMVEVPSNVILAEEFGKIFDGFSIGSNDLTQLTLGVDRDSSLVAHVYDERNEAVKTLIRQVIKAAKKTNTKVGICGQAPSDYIEFAEFLVREGIDSISLIPNTIVKTTIAVNKLEEKMKNA